MQLSVHLERHSLTIANPDHNEQWNASYIQLWYRQHICCSRSTFPAKDICSRIFNFVSIINENSTASYTRPREWSTYIGANNWQPQDEHSGNRKWTQTYPNPNRNPQPPPIIVISCNLHLFVPLQLHGAHQLPMWSPCHLLLVVHILRLVRIPISWDFYDPNTSNTNLSGTISAPLVLPTAIPTDGQAFQSVYPL